MRSLLAWLLLASTVCAAPPMGASAPWCGLEVVSFEDGGKGLAKPPSVHGVFVTENNPQFNRFGGGREIRTGDLIAAVDGVAVETVEQFRDALKGKRMADLKVYALAKDRLSLRFTVRNVSVRSRGEFAKEHMSVTADPIERTKSVAIDIEKVYGKVRIPEVSLIFTLDQDGKATSPRLLLAIARPESLGLKELAVRSGDDVIRIALDDVGKRSLFGKMVEATSVPLDGDALKAAGRLVTDKEVSFCLRGESEDICLSSKDVEVLRMTMTAFEAYGGQWPAE